MPVDASATEVPTIVHLVGSIRGAGTIGPRPCHRSILDYCAAIGTDPEVIRRRLHHCVLEHFGVKQGTGCCSCSAVVACTISYYTFERAVAMMIYLNPVGGITTIPDHETVELCGSFDLRSTPFRVVEAF